MIRILGFIDPFELLTSLKSRLGEFKGLGVRELVLRGPRVGADDPEDDLAFSFKKPLERWPEARAIIRRIEREGSNLLQGELEFGRIFFEMLDAGAHQPFAREDSTYFKRFMRVHLGLRTNPAAMLISGTASIPLGYGMLAMVDVTQWHGAINGGDHARVNLVLDVKRKEFSARLPEEESPETAERTVFAEAAIERMQK